MTVCATYVGEEIIKRNLLGTIITSGVLDFYYHHSDPKGEIMIGKCRSTPEYIPGEKMVLKEEW